VKVSVGLPTHRVDRPDQFLTCDAITEMARAAETAGFDAVFVTEHPVPGDAWLASGGHHALDPFVVLSVAAAATTRLRLHTNLIIAAYRNPYLLAKAMASLDVVSGGRLIAGIGTGYLEAEFAALGVDFDERNDLTDEALIAMKDVWRGSSVDFRGRHFATSGNTALPRPIQQPHPPIWIGGNSKRAIRRAVESGDGWAPMPNPARSARRRHSPPLETIEDLRRGVAYARAHAEAVGRSQPLEIVFMPLGLDMLSAAGYDPAALLANVAELEAAGVTYFVVSFPTATRAEFCEGLGRFGEDVITSARPR
jgi:probable F420-dependent oxidoreductase